MERLIVLVVLSVAAVGIALLLQRRRPDPPSVPSYRSPAQLDRNDFDRPDAPTLVVVFASSTCASCPDAWALAQESAVKAPSQIVAQQVTVQQDPELHKRYRIDGVPTTLVVGANGVVAQAFFGPLDDAELEDAVAQVVGGNS